MLTGSEPHKLRGILNKEPQSLMTRFGPSPERGPGTQPHIGRTSNILVSEFSVVYVIQRSTNVSYSVSIDRAVAQYYNAFNRHRAVAQYYIHQGECSYRHGSGPMVFVYIM